MQTIEETPRENRFLMVGARGSANDWKRVCRSVREYAASREESDHGIDQSLRLLNAVLPSTSESFAIISAYADIPTGTSWDTVFDPKDGSAIESTNAVFRFGIFGDRVAIPSLEHGHHQIAVIEFPEGLPKILNVLPEVSD